MGARTCILFLHFMYTFFASFRCFGPSTDPRSSYYALVRKMVVSLRQSYLQARRTAIGTEAKRSTWASFSRMFLFPEKLEDGVSRVEREEQPSPALFLPGVTYTQDHHRSRVECVLTKRTHLHKRRKRLREKGKRAWDEQKRRFIALLAQFQASKHSPWPPVQVSLVVA